MRSQLKDEFMAMASHEIKTPLAIALGYLHLIRESGEIIDSVGMLDKSVNQLNKISELIGNLMDVARIESGGLKIEFKRVDIFQLISEVASHIQLLTQGTKSKFRKKRRT